MSAIAMHILGAFGRQVKNTVPAVVDIGLLDQISITVDALADDTVNFQSMALAINHYLDVLKKTSFTSIDGLEELQQVFLETGTLAEKFYDIQVAKRQCAVDDPRLKEMGRIVESYNALLEQVAAFYNNVNSLAWIIGEHIAEFDEVAPGSFADAQELFKAIGV